MTRINATQKYLPTKIGKMNKNSCFIKNEEKETEMFKSWILRFDLLLTSIACARQKLEVSEWFRPAPLLYWVYSRSPRLSGSLALLTFSLTRVCSVAREPLNLDSSHHFGTVRCHKTHHQNYDDGTNFKNSGIKIKTWRRYVFAIW